MAIEFSQTRWDQVKDDAARWWAGELGRPLIQMICYGGRDPGRPAPVGRGLTRATLYNPAEPVEGIIDRWDYLLASQHFLGDAFPSVWPDLGPGVIAAFLGGTPEPTDDTVWFHPSQPVEIADLHLRYDADNPHYQRVRAICRAAMARWEGQVQVGMTDLGGNLDILSSFRPSEELLYDLYDAPEEVKRVTWEAHDLWWRYFTELNTLLQPANPGYTAWAPIYSTEPYYMLQCDFCYMISPEMFDEFVKPELVASCRKLGNAFYHLDGIGQLPHLDSLLAIEELKGIQWVPGDGQPGCAAWPEVYRKIRDAGKRTQLWGDPATLNALADQLGTVENVVFLAGCDPAHRTDAEAFLARYGAGSRACV